jgi:MFS superfamily sulfate permease-like transporter
VYHFAASLYYANANHFSTEIASLVAGADPPVRWLAVDASAIADVDFSGSETLREVAQSLREHGTKLVLAEVAPEVRSELDTYGVTDEIGTDAYYATVGELVRTFRADDNREDESGDAHG